MLQPPWLCFPFTAVRCPVFRASILASPPSLLPLLGAFLFHRLLSYPWSGGPQRVGARLDCTHNWGHHDLVLLGHNLFLGSGKIGVLPSFPLRALADSWENRHHKCPFLLWVTPNFLFSRLIVFCLTWEFMLYFRFWVYVVVHWVYYTSSRWICDSPPSTRPQITASLWTWEQELQKKLMSPQGEGKETRGLGLWAVRFAP